MKHSVKQGSHQSQTTTARYSDPLAQFRKIKVFANRPRFLYREIVAGNTSSSSMQQPTSIATQTPQSRKPSQYGTTSMMPPPRNQATRTPNPKIHRNENRVQKTLFAEHANTNHPTKNKLRLVGLADGLSGLPRSAA